MIYPVNSVIHPSNNWAQVPTSYLPSLVFLSTICSVLHLGQRRRGSVPLSSSLPRTVVIKKPLGLTRFAYKVCKYTLERYSMVAKGLSYLEWDFIQSLTLLSIINNVFNPSSFKYQWKKKTFNLQFGASLVQRIWVLQPTLLLMIFSITLPSLLNIKHQYWMLIMLGNKMVKCLYMQVYPH